MTSDDTGQVAAGTATKELSLIVESCSQDNPGDYRIRTIQGSWMSFEKEYYDLIRSAFLKYRYITITYRPTHCIPLRCRLASRPG